MLVKHYGNAAGEMQGQKRYSPSSFVSAEKRHVSGNPDVKNISISYVERQNLTMRIVHALLH